MSTPGDRTAADHLDSAFFEAVDRLRAALLRRRILWYCVAAAGILTLGAAACAHAAFTAQARDQARQSGILLVSNLLLIALYAWTFGYVKRRRPDRRRLVLALTGLTTAALTIAMPMEALADWALHLTWDGSPEGVEARNDTAHKAIHAFGFLFGLACLLVPMRLRDSLRIAAMCVPVLLTLVFVLLQPPNFLPVWFFAAYVTIGSAWSAWRFRDVDARLAASALNDKYTQIASHQRDIGVELAHARRIHESLFPQPIPAGPVRMDYRYAPMREIGGDFLFAAPGPKGALSIVLIDVSGHGVPAALSVNRLHGELQRLFAAHSADSQDPRAPGTLLAALNAYTSAALAPQGVYATALVMRITPPATNAPGSLEWASAGHPTALIRSHSGALAFAPSTATMLGALEPDLFDPAEHRLPLTPGDQILAYTDGASEARGAGGAEFGSAGIRALVEASPAPAGFAPRILRAVESHRAGGPQDDILIVDILVEGVA